LVAFKKLLQLSWESNNYEGELAAYEFLGVQYYYQGNMERAKFFHERALKGLTEAKTSSMRIISEKAYKKKESSRVRIQTERIVKKYNGMDGTTDIYKD
jgi:hypothetical protein